MHATGRRRLRRWCFKAGAARGHGRHRWPVTDTTCATLCDHMRGSSFVDEASSLQLIVVSELATPSEHLGLRHQRAGHFQAAPHPRQTDCVMRPCVIDHKGPGPWLLLQVDTVALAQVPLQRGARGRLPLRSVLGPALVAGRDCCCRCYQSAFILAT
jgi:hypothetical protein